MPIGSMTPQGIINLINMMHSKQYLINRAVGRECISIADSLINALAERTFEDTETAAGFITEQGGCSGVTFADGNIEFTGFPHTDNMMEYCRLASAMVKKASEQKRVNPKQTIEENEKYYMRAWLVSIGFGGSEGKEIRAFFLKGLKGHTAFGLRKMRKSGKPTAGQKGGQRYVRVSRQTLERLRKEYPAGTRVELIRLDDPYRKIPSGTIGTVEFVDDAGQLHTVWDGHGALAMIYGWMNGER